MATWEELAVAEPEMAERGRALIYQYGPGLGFLATVGADGMPRIHPVCPIVANGALLVFVIPSPKRNDLERDGRYALHAFTPEDVDDEFTVVGHAHAVTDADVRAAAVAAYHQPVPGDHELFELAIERALLATYTHRGQWPPTYLRWREATLGHEDTSR
jgi:hypothetical protein